MIDTESEYFQQRKKMVEETGYDVKRYCGSDYKTKSEHARTVVNDVLYPSEQKKYAEFYQDEFADMEALGFDMSDPDVRAGCEARAWNKFDVYLSNYMQNSDALRKRYQRELHILPKWLRNYLRDTMFRLNDSDVQGYFWSE